MAANDRIISTRAQQFLDTQQSAQQAPTQQQMQQPAQQQPAQQAPGPQQPAQQAPVPQQPAQQAPVQQPVEHAPLTTIPQPAPNASITDLWTWPSDAVQPPAQQAPVTQPPAQQTAVDPQEADWRKMQRKMAIKSKLKLDPNALEQMAPEVSTELLGKVIDPLIDTFADVLDDEQKSLQDKLGALHGSIEAVTAQTTQREMRQRELAINAQVSAVVPDMAAIIRDPNFKVFLSTTKAPMSSVPLGVNLQDAYSQGDANTIASIMQAYKGTYGGRSIEEIAGVAPTGYTATAPGQPQQQEGEYTYADMHQKRRDYQTGRISAAELDEYKKGFANAKKLKLVK